jgi:hypothetical protein
VLIKGTGIRSLLLAIERVQGAGAVAAVKAAVPPHIRAQIEPQIVVSRQYPVEVSASLQVAIRDVLGGGSWELSRRLGVEAAYIDFQGIYRIFLRALDYGSVWNRLERAWLQYNSQGAMRWADRTKTSARAVITGVEGYNEGLWGSVAGRVEGLLLLSGAKKAEVLVIDPTPESCTLAASWKG